jgi:hypothetical protein
VDLSILAGVDFYVPAILLRIERISLLKIIATIADGRSLVEMRLMPQPNFRPL